MREMMKRMVRVVLLMGVAGVLAFAGVPSASATIVTVLATNMTLTGLADPGGITGDSAGTTGNSNDYWFWNPTGNPVAPNNVVGLAQDASGNPISARGRVEFTLNQGLPDDYYSISALLQPNNIHYDNSGGLRNEGFAMIMNTSGGAKFNGVANGSSTWFVLNPNYNDSSVGGATPPWKTVYLAGGANPDFSTFVWNSLPAVHLEGVDGVTGKLNIYLLDATGLNYGFINAASFTFVGTPEPSTFMLLGTGAFMLYWRRRR